MIMIETPKKEELILDKKEVLRYLGYGKNSADDSVIQRIDEISEKIKEDMTPKICFEKFSLFKENGALRFGTVETTSQNLGKNLADCSEVIVFVATIGVGFERLMGRLSAVSPVDALICQAVGTAYIEALCDEFCQKLKDKEQGKFLRPRFSPGYGDFGIENQKEILNMLDAFRKIGVSLTGGFQMIPSKSVTAVVGIGEKELYCTHKGCEECDKTDCEYRR